MGVVSKSKALDRLGQACYLKRIGAAHLILRCGSQV